MAKPTKRIGKDGQASYMLRVFVSQNKETGKQTMQSKTWKPTPGITEKQIEKALAREQALFEEQVKNGLVYFDGNTTFREYSVKWLENAELAVSTRDKYREQLTRINAAIGDIRLQKLQAHHLEEFYQNLKKPGINERGHYSVAAGLDQAIADKGIKMKDLAKQAGISNSTLYYARHGGHMSHETAASIAKVLGVDVGKTFKQYNSADGLADRTIVHYCALISVVLSQAKRERIVAQNVAEFARKPKVKRKELLSLMMKKHNSFTYC